MKNKPRGLRRKCRNMVRQLTQQTAAFPQPHRGDDFWHLHLPIAQNFIDHPNTPFGLRRLCVQTLIDCAHSLASVAPTNLKSRVVVAICLPELWRSQIIVFFGSDYYDSFFNRDSEEQKWTPLPDNRRLAREWNLRVPHGFSQRGYKEELRDTDFNFDGEIWFMGQLNYSGSD